MKSVLLVFSWGILMISGTITTNYPPGYWNLSSSIADLDYLEENGTRVPWAGDYPNGENLSTTEAWSGTTEPPKKDELVWPIRLAAEVPGDLVLGGLMMVHEREDTRNCGPVMPQGGIQAVEAMLYTLDRINERGLPFTIGAHILDDCDKDTYGLEMAVEFIKDADADLGPRAALLERKLRSLKRNILGTSNVDKDSIERDDVFLFEAQVSSAVQDWEKFEVAFDEREGVSELLGDKGDFPSTSWLTLYNQLRKEIITSKGILMLLKSRFESETVKAQNQSSLLNTTTSSCKPQLPRIPIPQFSGDMTKWTHFRDTFTSMVHNEPTLSDVEKFYYLIGALHGEASELLSRFPVEETSYKQAWEKVLQTYDNPRILASMLVHRIRDCDIKSYKNELQRYEAFLTGVADSIEAFRAQKLNDPCEFLLSTLSLRALDSEIRKQFELSLKSSKDFPTADDVISFVRQRKTALKMSMSSSSFDSSSSTSHIPSSRTTHSNSYTQKSKAVSLYSSDSGSSESCQQSKPSRRCFKCKGDHHLYGCHDFKKMNVGERIQLIRTAKVCWNCLRPGHRVLDCKSKFKCHTCRKPHHMLLHQEPKGENQHLPKIQRQNPPPQAANNATQSAPDQNGTVVAFGASPNRLTTQTVLLGTVRLLIKANKGGFHSARALLDSGSQHSFMTSSLAKTIGAKISGFSGSITTLGESAVSKTHIKGAVHCSIRPFTVDEEYGTVAIVVDRITSTLPNCQVPSSITDKLQEYALADHQFAEPSSVDLLIGVDLYPQLITGSPRHSGIQDLYLVPTVFGLAVTGSMSGSSPETSHTYFVGSESSTIESQLRAFWEIEEPIHVTASNPDDDFCEEHFIRKHSRTPEGSYVVRFPFKGDVTKLSRNREHVLRRFRNLELKLEKDHSLAQACSNLKKHNTAQSQFLPKRLWNSGSPLKSHSSCCRFLMNVASSGWAAGFIIHNSKAVSRTLSQRFRQGSPSNRSLSSNVPKLKVGDLVVLLERRCPVGQRPIARVIDTFPGRNGTIRTVPARTPSSQTLPRAVISLIPLFPPEERENSSS